MAFLVLILSFASIWFAAGDMRTAVTRRLTRPRIVLSDLFALILLISISLAVAMNTNIIDHRNLGLMTSGLAVFFWLAAVVLLSCAGVGNPLKRFWFILALPVTIAACCLWWVYGHWLSAWAWGDLTVRWTHIATVVTTPVAIAAARKLNSWVASVDAYYDQDSPPSLFRRHQA